MKFFKQSKGLALSLIFIWICQPLFAQQNDVATDTTVYKMNEIIVSASKYKESPESVGRNVTVISQDELQKSVHTSVSELLAEQQSIHMIGAGQTQGSLQQAFVRNANANHSVVMIDGVRISDPSTNNNALDLSELSLSGIKRIEIVRGSHSTLYGSSAIGGVINIITQKQGTEGFNGSVETKHGRFGEGTYSTTNSLYANYTSSSGFYGNAGIDYQNTQGLDATIDTVSNASGFNPQDQDNFEKLDLTGKVGYKTDRFDIYGSYRRADQRVDADQGAYQDDSNAYTDFKRDLFGYGAGFDLSEQLNISFQGAYSDLKRTFKNDSSLVSSSGSYDGTFVENNGTGMLWENEIKGILKVHDLKLTAGLSASRQTMNNRSYTYSRSKFGVFESKTNLDSLNLKDVTYNAYLHADLGGGLILERLDAFSLVLGGRYINHDEFGTYFTYEINPKLQLTSSTLIYGSLTSGFNTPSLYQLYSPSTKGFTTRGNPNLDPEKSVSYEIGWKQEIGQKLSFEISAYQTNVRDVIEYVYLWDGSTGINKLNSKDYLGDTYVNASEQRVRGIEFSGTAFITSNLKLDGSISLTRSRITFGPGDINTSYTDDNHVQLYNNGQFVTKKHEREGLTRRPSMSAFISASYWLTNSLRMKANSRFVGSRDDIFYSASLGPNGALARSNVSNYNVTDVSFRYKFSNKFSTSAKVENVLDTDYTEINGYQTRGRGIFLKLQYRFGNR